jgi:hypothetical protein
MLSLDLVTYVYMESSCYHVIIRSSYLYLHGIIMFTKKRGMKSGAPESLTCDSRRVSVNEANTNSYGVCPSISATSDYPFDNFKLVTPIPSITVTSDYPFGSFKLVTPIPSITLTSDYPFGDFKLVTPIPSITLTN